jgi:hypothetical protein
MTPFERWYEETQALLVWHGIDPTMVAREESLAHVQAGRCGYRGGPAHRQCGAPRAGSVGGGRNDADQHLTHPGEVVFRNARNIVLEGYRVEAARLALSLGPHDGLAQVQEP